MGSSVSCLGQREPAHVITERRITKDAARAVKSRTNYGADHDHFADIIRRLPPTASEAERLNVMHRLQSRRDVNPHGIYHAYKTYLETAHLGSHDPDVTEHVRKENATSNGHAAQLNAQFSAQKRQADIARLIAVLPKARRRSAQDMKIISREIGKLPPAHAAFDQNTLQYGFTRDHRVALDTLANAGIGI